MQQAEAASDSTFGPFLQAPRFTKRGMTTADFGQDLWHDENENEKEEEKCETKPQTKKRHVTSAAFGQDLW